jgi:hypothetical protein
LKTKKIHREVQLIVKESISLGQSEENLISRYSLIVISFHREHIAKISAILLRDEQTYR